STTPLSGVIGMPSRASGWVFASNVIFASGGGGGGASGMTRASTRASGGGGGESGVPGAASGGGGGPSGGGGGASGTPAHVWLTRQTPLGQSVPSTHCTQVSVPVSHTSPSEMQSSVRPSAHWVHLPVNLPTVLQIGLSVGQAASFGQSWTHISYVSELLFVSQNGLSVTATQSTFVRHCTHCPAGGSVGSHSGFAG